MRTATRPTSIQCYHELPLSDQQLDVIAALRVLGKSCIADVADLIHWEKSTVSGRMNELKAYGVIVPAGKYHSLTTGIMSEFWRLREFKETLF